jgi:hypothetical protein
MVLSKRTIAIIEEHVQDEASMQRLIALAQQGNSSLCISASLRLILQQLTNAIASRLYNNPRSSLPSSLPSSLLSSLPSRLFVGFYLVMGLRRITTSLSRRWSHQATILEVICSVDSKLLTDTHLSLVVVREKTTRSYSTSSTHTPCFQSRNKPDRSRRESSSRPLGAPKGKRAWLTASLSLCSVHDYCSVKKDVNRWNLRIKFLSRRLGLVIHRCFASSLVHLSFHPLVLLVFSSSVLQTLCASLILRSVFLAPRAYCPNIAHHQSNNGIALMSSTRSLPVPILESLPGSHASGMMGGNGGGGRPPHKISNGTGPLSHYDEDLDIDVETMRRLLTVMFTMVNH